MTEHLAEQDSEDNAVTGPDSPLDTWLIRRLFVEGRFLIRLVPIL